MRLLRSDQVPIRGFRIEEIRADLHSGTTRIYLSIPNLNGMDMAMRIDTTTFDPAYANLGSMFAEDNYLLDMVSAMHLTPVQVNDAIFSRLIPLFFLSRDQLSQLQAFYVSETDILDVVRSVSLPARQRIGWDILSSVFPQTDFILAVGVWQPMIWDNRMIGHFTNTCFYGYTSVPEDPGHLLEHELWFRVPREDCTLH